MTYHQSGMDFSEWLVAELDQRGWSRSEAARRGDISSSMFDKVINGYAKPGKKFLDGLAQAFEMPPIVLYRKAGLLEPEPDKSELVEQIMQEVHQMDESGQQEFLAYVRMRNNLRKQQQPARKK